MVIVTATVITTIADAVEQCHYHIVNGYHNHNDARHNHECHHSSLLVIHSILPFTVRKVAMIPISVYSPNSAYYCTISTYIIGKRSVCGYLHKTSARM